MLFVNRVKWEKLIQCYIEIFRGIEYYLGSKIYVVFILDIILLFNSSKIKIEKMKIVLVERKRVFFYGFGFIVVVLMEGEVNLEVIYFCFQVVWIGFGVEVFFVVNEGWRGSMGLVKFFCGEDFQGMFFEFLV